MFGRIRKIQRGGWVFTSRSVYVFKKKITTFIYICFGNNYFCVFQQLLGTHRWSCAIAEFIGSLTVDYSPIDNDRLMSLKAKIVILFLG